MKRQVRDGEKIFPSHTADKALKSKIYKELWKLNIKKTNNPIKNMVNQFKRRGCPRYTDGK